MKLKLILLQDVLRVAATILHPPIRSAASSPTSRLDGEAKNTLVGRGTEGSDAPDADDDDVRISGIHTATAAKLKLVLSKLVDLIKQCAKLLFL